MKKNPALVVHVNKLNPLVVQACNLVDDEPKQKRPVSRNSTGYNVSLRPQTPGAHWRNIDDTITDQKPHFLSPHASTETLANARASVRNLKRALKSNKNLTEKSNALLDNDFTLKGSSMVFSSRPTTAVEPEYSVEEIETAHGYSKYVMKPRKIDFNSIELPDVVPKPKYRYTHRIIKSFSKASPVKKKILPDIVRRASVPADKYNSFNSDEEEDEFDEVFITIALPDTKPREDVIDDDESENEIIETTDTPPLPLSDPSSVTHSMAEFQVKQEVLVVEYEHLEKELEHEKEKLERVINEQVDDELREEEYRETEKVQEAQYHQEKQEVEQIEQQIDEQDKLDQERKEQERILQEEVEREREQLRIQHEQFVMEMHAAVAAVAEIPIPTLTHAEEVQLLEEEERLVIMQIEQREAEIRDAKIKAEEEAKAKEDELKQLEAKRAAEEFPMPDPPPIHRTAPNLAELAVSKEQNDSNLSISGHQTKFNIKSTSDISKTTLTEPFNPHLDLLAHRKPKSSHPKTAQKKGRLTAEILNNPLAISGARHHSARYNNVHMMNVDDGRNSSNIYSSAPSIQVDGQAEKHVPIQSVDRVHFNFLSTTEIEDSTNKQWVPSGSGKEGLNKFLRHNDRRTGTGKSSSNPDNAARSRRPSIDPTTTNPQQLVAIGLPVEKKESEIAPPVAGPPHGKGKRKSTALPALPSLKEGGDEPTSALARYHARQKYGDATTYDNSKVAEYKLEMFDSMVGGNYVEANTSLAYRFWLFYQHLKETNYILPKETRKELSMLLTKSFDDPSKLLSRELNLLSRYEYCRQKVAWNFLRFLSGKCGISETNIERNVAMIFANVLVGDISEDHSSDSIGEIKSYEQLSDILYSKESRPLEINQQIAYECISNYGTKVFNQSVARRASDPQDYKLMYRSLKD